MKYVADDGKVFDDLTACTEHEAELKRLAESKGIARAEVERLREAFYEAGEKYANVVEDYNKRFAEQESEEPVSFGELLAWLLS